MRDLHASLVALSERGTPVGSARLRERVALQLAGGGSVAEWAAGWRLPGPALAALAAVVALIVFGGLALILNWPGRESVVPTTTLPVTTTAPTTTLPTTTTAAPTTTVTTEATTTTAAEIVLPAPTPLVPAPENLVMTWETVESPAFDEAEVPPNVLAAGTSGVVAVGPGGAIFVSPDGRDWTPSADPALAQGGVGDLAVWREGMVAVGGYCHRDPGEADHCHAAVWLSADGVTWTRVPDQESLSGPRGTGMSAVTAGGPGLVAVGVYDPDQFNTHAAVWLSADGLTWTRVAPELIQGEGAEEPTVVGRHASEPSQFGQAAMLDVTVGGPGLIATGTVDPYAWRAVPAVWLSEDGSSWEQILLDPGVEGASGYSVADAVAAGAHGIAVVGQVGDRQGYAGSVIGEAVNGLGAVWVSENGRDWRLAGVLDAAGADTPTCRYREHLQGALWVGDTLLVTGSATTTCQTRDDYRLVWASADLGQTWHEIARVASPEKGSPYPMAELALVGSRVVAIGGGVVWLGSWAAE